MNPTLFLLLPVVGIVGGLIAMMAFNRLVPLKRVSTTAIGMVGEVDAVDLVVATTPHGQAPDRRKATAASKLKQAAS